MLIHGSLTCLRLEALLYDTAGTSLEPTQKRLEMSTILHSKILRYSKLLQNL